MNPPEYLTDLVNAFERNANPANAVQMKKYMKDLFDFYGISSPKRKELFKTHWNDHGYKLKDETNKVIKWCWQAPQREYQYFGMELLNKNVLRANIDDIHLYEHIILHKSWWDTVDFIAAKLVGAFFNRHPEQVESYTTKWIQSGNIWLQRTCLLFQLKYKSKTNTQLLETLIPQLSGSKEFFIRKAIGWALREYSKTDSKFVVQFTKRHHLSGLSEREALKWMKHQSIID
jgi:3-methyladenine DNA glycosylase AlkD